MAQPQIKPDPWNVHDAVREEFAKRRKYGRTPLRAPAAHLCLAMIDCVTLADLRDAWRKVTAAKKTEVINEDEYRALAEEKDVCKRRIELLTDSQAPFPDDNRASMSGAPNTLEGGM